MKRPLATVWAADCGNGAWLVANTPLEVVAAVEKADANQLIDLTCANPDEAWNGRTIYVRADSIKAIGPPLDLTDYESELDG